MSFEDISYFIHFPQNKTTIICIKHTNIRSWRYFTFRSLLPKQKKTNKFQIQNSNPDRSWRIPSSFQPPPKKKIPKRWNRGNLPTPNIPETKRLLRHLPVFRPVLVEILSNGQVWTLTSFTQLHVAGGLVGPGLRVRSCRTTVGCFGVSIGVWTRWDHGGRFGKRVVWGGDFPFFFGGGWRGKMAELVFLMAWVEWRTRFFVGVFFLWGKNVLLCCWRWWMIFLVGFGGI